MGEVPGVGGILPMRIDFSLGGKKLPSQSLAQAGAFELTVDLPAKTGEILELQMLPASHFVPAALGINSDTRQLAFRLTDIRME